MLELRSVNAGYGSFQALFDVSLEVKAGEAVAVIGPNGAGKTTLLRAMTRLIDLRSGQLSMESKDFTQAPAHEVVSWVLPMCPRAGGFFRV